MKYKKKLKKRPFSNNLRNADKQKSFQKKEANRSANDFVKKKRRIQKSPEPKRGGGEGGEGNQIQKCPSGRTKQWKNVLARKTSLDRKWKGGSRGYSRVPKGPKKAPGGAPLREKGNKVTTEWGSPRQSKKRVTGPTKKGKNRQNGEKGGGNSEKQMGSMGKMEDALQNKA